VRAPGGRVDSIGSPATRAAFALDILALMDAPEIRRAVLAGYDWGSRTGDIIAAPWPRRVKALVSVTGYLITNLALNREPPATVGRERLGFGRGNGVLSREA
jgi:pimeloyl-ACP methyl ester carboxylesterase